MIQDHTQNLLNKDHQHHRSQSQKSWTLFQDHWGCAGQAADAVPAYTQVKMEDAPTSFESKQFTFEIDPKGS